MNPDRIRTSLSKLIACALVAALVAALGAARPATAMNLPTEADPPQPGLLEPLTTVPAGDGISVSWKGIETVDEKGKATVNDGVDWPLTQTGGLWLPVRYVTLEAVGALKIEPEILELNSRPWSGTAEAVAAIVPKDPISGEEFPELARKPAGELPAGPVFVSHESMVRGRRVVVLAISPVFQSKDGPQIATRIQARVAGTKLFDTASASAFSAERGIELPTAKSSLDGPSAPAVYAINPLANQSALRITVSSPGLQRVPASALSAMGVTPSSINQARVRLFFLGNEFPLHWRDLGSNPGSLDASDEFVFYVPSVGDRYNQTSVYWLAVDPNPVGARMALANAQVSNNGLPTASQVRERGSWRNPVLYQSLFPGQDGDHWFNKLLTIGFASNDPSLTVNTPVSMPPISGSSAVTLTVYGKTGFPHLLQAAVGGSTVTSGWSGAGDSSRSFAMSASASSVTFSMLPVSCLPNFAVCPDSVLADSAEWERPVAPNVSGNGGDFYTIPNVEQIYSLTGYNSSWPMYDVTDPLQPRVLQTSVEKIQSGPAARHVIFAGPSFVRTPVVAANTPVDLAAPRSADVVYIGPAALHSTLNPLITLRQGQGYQTQVVDIAGVYSTFGFGMVSPPAIRNFLRHAVGTWTRKPIAAVLVGDGTVDPFNYLAKSYAFANFVPPYLLHVDPYAGETSCDTCYAQLDNDDPLSDGMPDIWLGRLSANSTTELATLVSKMVTYESSSTISNWNKTLGWLADNYREANGATDPGGDFAGYQERLANAAWQSPAGITPSGTLKSCAYYNPYAPTVGSNPCFEPNAVTAHTKAMAVYNQGAAIVTYNGHGNYQQLAGTDPGAAYPNNALLNYFDPFYDNGPTDPYGGPILSNGNKLPIVMQLTCLTSGFQVPGQYFPQSIDERLVLAPNGGALAVWGSSGSGVSHGHDYLARGFFNQLWSTQPGEARLGELVQAGYLNLFQGAYACCGDSIRTYLLLGDPLTKARVSFTWVAPKRIYVPLVNR